MGTVNIRSLLRGVHNCIMIAAVFSCIVLALSRMGGYETGSYWMWLLFGVFALAVLFVLGEKLIFARSSFWVFTGVVIAYDAGLFFVSGLLFGWHEILRMMLLFASVVVSGLLYYEHNTERVAYHPTIASLAVYAVLWIFGSVSKNSEVMVVAVICQIMDIFVYIVHHEMTNLDFAMNQVKERAYVPSDMINHQNRFELVFFLIPVAAVTGLCFLVPYSDRIAEFLYKLVTRLTRVIMALMKQQYSGDNTTSEQVKDMSGGFQMTENPAFRWFWDVFFGVMLFLMAALIVWAIVKGVILFYRHFQKVKFNADRQVSEFLTPGEGKDDQKKAADEKLGFFDQSPAALIRRHYIRFIKKHPDSSKIARAHTPYQIETISLGEKRDDYEELHQLYEKARYSDAEVTREELSRVRRMK